MKKSVWLVGLIAVLLILPACGKKEEAPKETAAAPQQQAQPAASDHAMPMDAAMAAGEKIYNESCQSCHAEGIAGAPKLGDKDAWADRIAQGMETLNSNSINGFTGKTGMMPAKGGNAALSDDEVKAAVAYMVAHSQ
jgi:cytochrome c5